MGPVSVRDFHAIARLRLESEVYDFIAGGADGEVTVAANESAYARIGLLPRVLRGAGGASGGPDRLAVEVLGCRLSYPVMIGPTAFHRLAHPDGELATARAAAKAGTVLVTGMTATVAIEEAAAAAGGDLWFQLYLQPDLDFTEAVVRRAEAAGCRALVVTVDSPVFGRRERDLRNGFDDLPPGLRCENMREPLPGGGWGTPRSIAFRPDLSWRDIEWLRGITALPIVLKGITHPSDARLAVEHGADALIVSNHGGRQLDTVPPTIALLPAIAEAVAGAVPLLLDGGIRRGTDVVKALALGASAVAIGRPALWGLAAGGEQGVYDVLDLLRDELERALTLCGCAGPADVDRGIVTELPC
jgi:4-hydroxymandelate oxidase